MQLCWAGCPGGFRGTTFYARFTRLRVSRTRGAYASPRHLGERNCTSTAPKLSKTAAVLTPHPWHLCHFEGTDRSFAMYVAFLRSDYYGQFDCLRGLGVSLGSRLPTLHPPYHPLQALPCSRHRTQTDAVGGVFLDAPSALCGSPMLTQGKTG